MLPYAVSPPLPVEIRAIYHPVKSVLFDFGGVLAKPDEEALVAYLAQFFSVSEDKIREIHPEEFQWIRVNDAEFAFWQRFAQEVGQELPEGWRSEYQAVKLNAVKELPGIHALLSDLTAQGYQLDILSNFEPWMEPILERLDYRNTFAHLYLSYETGHAKPSPAAYQAVLSDLGLLHSEILFIDDQLKNVEAARALGIDAIHFETANQLLQELIDRNLL